MIATKQRLKAGILTIILGFVAIALSLWYFGDQPLLTPLTETPTFRFMTGQETPNSSGKVIYGYLPYWNLNKVTLQPELTHLSYFSLTMGGDGKIVTRTDEGGEPGYNRLQSDELLDLSNQVTQNGGQIEVTLAQFNNDAIVSLLSSPKAHQNLLDSLDSLLLAYPVSGINIDIEYTGEVTDPLRQRFVELMSKLRTHLNSKYKGVNLSIAMYAGASSSYSLWDIERINPQVDHIVVMAYDFHRRSSPQAGPVAPLFGGKEMWDSDINHHLQNFVKKVPSEKLLLGVPFYGYEWQTTSRNAQAHTFPDTGATASYSRVQDILSRKDELQVEEHWNEEALSPYISYKEKGATYVIYFENSRSLSYKLDYVNQLNLGGIAIWALGYESDSRELWDVIERKL